MAKKVILKDDNVEIMPITRGELILDSSGQLAFHSSQFLATQSLPGLMSGEDKTKLDSLEKVTVEDKKVEQVNTTTNRSYRILFSNSADDTTKTEGARKSAKLLFNPSTGALTATALIGKLNWSNLNNVPENFTPAQHIHNTSEITALTSYSKASSASDLVTTDTLNAALGKLEYKAHYAYDWVISVTSTDTDEYINKWGEIVGFLDSVKEGTDILDEFVTRKTALVITGQKNFNTNTGATPVIISRGGGSTEAVAIGINDSQAVFEYTNDEKANSYVFKMVNTDTERSDGSGANESYVMFSGSSSGSSVTATTFIGRLNNTLTFSAGAFATKTYNNSSAVTVNIPTHTSHLTNNSGFLTLHLSLANYVTLNGTLTISGVKTFSTLLKFTVALGTAPFTVTSTTKVSNLNSDMVDGYHISTAGTTKPWSTIVTIGSDGVSEMGRYIDFHYDNTTGSDYSTRLQCGGNHSNTVTLPSATGTLALTSQIPSALKNPKKLTIFGVEYDGSTDKTITAVTMISTLSEGSSNITDQTEILTSYASDNGFADTNAPNVVYKRDAVKLYNYINAKLAATYAGLNKTGTVTSVAISNGGGIGISGSPITSSGTIIISNAGVRSTTINGNYLRVNTNGTNADLTIPYATTASLLSNTSVSDPSKAASGLYLKWYSLVSQASGYAGTNYGFPVSNNANGILWLGTHSGPYGWQMGFSSNGRIYARYISNNSFSTTANGGSWNRIAWTSDIPAVTNYYWANVKVSATSSTTTTPTFANTVINGTLTMGGTIIAKSGSSTQGIKFENSYLNSISSLLLWQSSEAIRFGSSSWDWNSWAGLKYNHSSKIIYLGLADGTIFNANSGLSGGKLYLPGISDAYVGNGTYKILHLGNSSVSGGGSAGGSSITVNIGNNSKTLTIPTSLPANGGTSSYTNYLKIHDVRGTNHLPNSSTYPEKNITAWFNNTGTPDGSWWSGITVKGWTSDYSAWLLCSYSFTGTANNYGLYVRNGVSSGWGSWRVLLDSGNSSIGDYNVKINGTTKQFVRDWGHGAANMNAVARGGRSSMGMADLSTPSGGTATAVNPNGGTSWHHFINIAYTDGGAGSNSWITQIANKAGTTDLWVRSRSGGTISDTANWAAGWTRILTGTNYTHVLDSRYVNTAGDTMTGPLTFANGTWNVVGDDAAIGDYNAAGMLGLKSINNNIPGIGFHNSSNTLLGRLQANGSNLLWNDNKIWHAGNDGSGSGLDADLLDGKHASAFALASHGVHWEGFTKRANSNASWGTLIASNGYTPLFWLDSNNTGGVAFSDYSGQTFMQIDGYFYQNEGKNRVTDITETVTALGTSGNYLTWTKNGTTNNITIPYASSAGALGNYSIQHFMTYDNGNSNYLAASFTNENFSKKAAEKYIEYWDSTGGWFNSRWGLVLAISGFHRVGSSDSYVLLGGGGHKALSDFAMASAYVKKAGDTMTGVLSMKNDVNPRILFIPNSGSNTLGAIYLMGGSSTAYSGIKYKFRQWSYTANSLTRLSYYEDYNLPETPAGLTANASYTILTTKNASISGGGSSWGSSITVKINGTTKTLTIPANPNTWRGITDSYSGTDSTISLSQKGGNALYNALVNGYASSAGNADTVDNLHASDFVRAYGTYGASYSYDSDWGLSIVTFDPVVSGTYPENNPNITILNLGNNYARRKQLACTYNNNNIYYRRRIDSSWSEWVRLAIAGESYTKGDSDGRYYPISGNVNMSGDNKWIGSTMGGGTDYWRIGGSGTSDNGVCQITIGDNSNDYFQIVIADYTGTNYTALLVKAGGTYAPHFYENSDQRLKTNIQTILNKDNIPQIKEFDWKESGEHSYGLIAQELEDQGYSELVSTKDDGYKTVNYSAALSLIVGKLQVKIKELEKEIEILKKKN